MLEVGVDQLQMILKLVCMSLLNPACCILCGSEESACSVIGFKAVLLCEQVVGDNQGLV